jgi:hypothetical protein
MTITVGLALIATGSAALVVLRDGRLLVAALAVQWAGMAYVVAESLAGSANGMLPAETVTALVCLAVMGLTLRSVLRTRADQLPGLTPDQAAALRRQENPDRERAGVGAGRRALNRSTSRLADQLWLWLIVIAGGVVGFGLARLYPPGGAEQVEVAFYWLLLSGVLALVVDGARNPVKLAVGLLALLNGAVLLAASISPAPPGPVFMGLMAAGRLGLVATLSYSWLVLRLFFVRPDMDTLFNARDGLFVTGTELATAGGSPEQSGADQGGATGTAGVRDAGE